LARAGYGADVNDVAVGAPPRLLLFGRAPSGVLGAISTVRSRFRRSSALACSWCSWAQAGVLVPVRVVGMFHSARGNLHLGTFGNVLAAASVRFDSCYYLNIARHGYGKTTGAPVFFPLYPLLIRALSYLTGSEALAGIAI
jgi:hypothetical protein